MTRLHIALALILVFAFAGAAFAEDFDPYLHQKAQEYTDWLMQWHSTGLGGVSDILFTDENRTEILRTWGSGDSEDWTATYLVSQAIRYQVTGEQEAYDEVKRITEYLHIIKDVTGDPGYLARYVAPNEPPWNVEYPPTADNLYLGEGEYEGMFWLGHNVRDKYITWFWGLTWAYDVLKDEDQDMKDRIEQDFRDVALTLESNDWTIIDPWGDIYSAADIGPDLRLAFLLQTAHVTGDPLFWTKFDTEFERAQNIMWLTTNAIFNRYSDYYAFINNYSNTQPVFRLWPDRERFQKFFDIWKFAVRLYSGDGHNPFFDSVYYGGCLRLGNCEPDELAYIEDDSYQSLVDMNEAPNWERRETVREDLELDPFSVWADEFLAQFPWIEELTGWDIDPQTRYAREISDRCWCSVMWERSPHHLQCTNEDNPAHTTHGADYLIAYWLGVWYGILPGDGPYGDDDLIEPDDDDDDNDDNDDDNNDDDDNDDNDDDDDNDTPADDDDDDNDNDDDDDNDDSGCGC